jgi:hypothetical protein
MTPKNRKKYRIFMFSSAGCSFLMADGGLRISKLQFLIKKIKKLISSSKFFSFLGHQTLDPDPGSGSGIRN